MKKDIEWLKEKIKQQDIIIEKGYIRTGFLMSLIDKLDEPEVLSQKWIDEHKELRINNLRKRTTNDVVPVEDLQNLLVPKQELPVIPKFVADYIEECKRFGKSLYAAMDSMPKEVSEWMIFDIRGFGKGQELFARAWLDGCTVEEEQKYYVDLDTAAYVAKYKDDDRVNIYTDGISGIDKFEFHLTEKEIKNYDERFWPFAKPVE